MFDLEQSIAEWRKQMRRAGVKSPVPLEELEVHLRDEIERQMELRRTDAAAFNLAAQKVGAARLVQGEFNKIEEGPKARAWKWAEIVILTWTTVVSLFMANLFQKSGAFSGARAWGLAAVGSLLLMVWGGRWIQPKFLARAKQIRNVIYLGSAVFVTFWWLAFFEIILPNHFSPLQLLVSLLWGLLLPMGAGVGVELGTKRIEFQKAGLLAS